MRTVGGVTSGLVVVVSIHVGCCMAPLITSRVQNAIELPVCSFSPISPTRIRLRPTKQRQGKNFLVNVWIDLCTRCQYLNQRQLLKAVLEIDSRWWKPSDQYLHEVKNCKLSLECWDCWGLTLYISKGIFFQTMGEAEIKACAVKALPTKGWRSSRRSVTLRELKWEFKE